MVEGFALSRVEGRPRVAVRSRPERTDVFSEQDGTSCARKVVPLADVVAGELDRHFKASAYQGDDDLVFCHPDTGGPLDRGAREGAVRDP